MNRKVVNATSTSYNGIKFRSKIELSIYKLLEKSELNFKYEDFTITLVEGFTPTKVSYIPRKRRGVKVTEFKEKVRPLTYTPDFTVYKNNKVYLIEVKGFETDRYIVKRKLLLKNKLKMTPVEKLTKLTEYLLNKDKELGRKFIREREFSKLREIVKSNILIVKNDRKKPEENRKYDNVDISILEAFLCEVDSYLLLLGLDEEIFEEEEYGE